MLSNTIPLQAIAFTSILRFADAAPSFAPRSTSSLSKRANTFVGCDETQRTKAGQAAADMANLAMWAYEGASTDSYGYKHYFKDDELDVFKTAMSEISGNNNPTNAAYNFIINCNPTDQVLDRCNSGDGSYAITDATVPANDDDFKSIWLCPLFFTGPDTKNNLPNTEDEAELQAWCNQKDYTFFPTAGHVLLHEITHLDAVAKLFPLDADDETGEHGTIDFAKSARPIYDARRLKVLVDNDPSRTDVPAPAYNAESYAGAATELWAQKFSGNETEASGFKD
ncbi:hypothetical protein G7Y79_00009g026480 [Physcia stellaris]|nr:hypothetical protein G7Y79_00009g026480 [Physcia stellaris]